MEIYEPVNDLKLNLPDLTNTETMEKKNIFSSLKLFGLTEYESKAYTTLVLKGSSKAGILARESKIPQSKIYEVLENLMSKHLVEMFSGRPKEFKAIPPKSAMESLMDEKEKEFSHLKAQASKISSILKPQDDQEILGGVWTHKGEKWNQFFNRLSEMLENADKYAYAITRDFSWTSKLNDAVAKVVKDKVDFRIMGMGQINDSNRARAKWYLDHGIPVKIFETSIHPRILVVDGKEVLIRLDHNPLKKEFSFHSIWSQDPSLVKVMDEYMKNLWKMSKPVKIK